MADVRSSYTTLEPGILRDALSFYRRRITYFEDSSVKSQVFRALFPSSFHSVSTLDNPWPSFQSGQGAWVILNVDSEQGGKLLATRL